MNNLTKDQGALELTLLNAEYSKARFDDALVEGLALGVPAEIMTRLEAIWAASKSVAGEVVAIGKIVVAQILAFLRANSGIATGIALGAAVGVLTAFIPFIGPLLAPLSATVAMLWSAGIGASFDSGQPTSDPLVAAVQLAKKFFELLQAIFLAVSEHVRPI